jgi:hypothetical protein
MTFIFSSFFVPWAWCADGCVNWTRPPADQQGGFVTDHPLIKGIMLSRWGGECH